MKRSRNIFGSRKKIATTCALKKFKTKPWTPHFATDEVRPEPIIRNEETVTVYRWEKWGKRYQSEGYYGPLSLHWGQGYEYLKGIDQYVRGCMSIVKDVYGDVPGFSEPMRCGTYTAEDMFEWVDRKAAAMMEQEGFEIGVYEVPTGKLYKGDDQCAFYTSDAKRLRGMSYIDLMVEAGYLFRSRAKEEDRFNELKLKYVERDNEAFRSMRW